MWNDFMNSLTKPISTFASRRRNHAAERLSNLIVTWERNGNVLPASCRQSLISEGGASRRPDIHFWGATAPSPVVIDVPTTDTCFPLSGVRTSVDLDGRTRKAVLPASCRQSPAQINPDAPIFPHSFMLRGRGITLQTRADETGKNLSFDNLLDGVDCMAGRPCHF